MSLENLTLITNVFLVGLVPNEEGPGLVMQISYLGKRVFLCEICASGYTDEGTAIGCEGYCRTHKTCSPQITKKAVLKPE